MGMKEVLKELSKGGFDDSDKRLTAFLPEVGITTHNPDGSWKGAEALLKDIAEVLERISDAN